MTNALRAAEVLLDFIGRIETGRTGMAAYNTIYGHKDSRLGKPLTEFTIDEILDAQRGWSKNFGSSAAGKFQIIRKTLLGLVTQIGIEGSRRFTKDLQDMLGYQLLKGRGYERFVAGQMPLKTFALALAKEWASMPVLEDVQGASRPVKRGQSYYAGDGLNKSLVSPEELERVLADVLSRARAPQPPPAPAPQPKPQPIPIPIPAPAQPNNGMGLLGWGIFIVVVLSALAYALVGIKF